MGKITFIPVKMTSIGPAKLMEKMTTIINQNPDKEINWSNFLSSGEQVEMNNLIKRLDSILEVAKKHQTPILLDAEQTTRQPALDYFAIYESKKWNKNDIVIYNTYQMYLKSTIDNLNKHLEIAKKENFFLGVKMVRGAYISSEKHRSIILQTNFPIFSTKVETDENYNKGLDLILKKIAEKQKCGIVIATHNFESVMKAGEICTQNKIPFDHPNIHFAQLKGMADNLTFGLEEAKFRVSKLAPFGPLDSVLPYLCRRLVENGSVLGGTQFERQLLWSELKRRKFGLW